MDSITSATSRQGVQTTGYIIRENTNRHRDSSAEKTLSKVAAEGLAEEMETALSFTNLSVGFAKYGNDKIAIIVRSKETGQIIREIPPEEIQRLQLRMEEINGTLLNHKA